MHPILGISRDTVTILQQYIPILELDCDKLATHQVFCLNWQALGRTKVVPPLLTVVQKLERLWRHKADP